ncbi:uncharacterized protein K444DRAFT_607387 [Hyaloscypha bicolor E]|uniref:Secreted protein n=1 Tax=Hyaloscypha bicolor E TaxID=1095630 RepID=A0A2J6TSH8_9HELO|nr:uncharacterized protein K444DRAFT_607387 [Hyaloscypha bicolor E]PMD65972.1 hypothetical protein K444DRAFT_607387 [Hyaloscypha bicolor E]
MVSAPAKSYLLSAWWWPGLPAALVPVPTSSIPHDYFVCSGGPSFLISTLTHQHQPTRRPDEYTAPRHLLVHREAPTAKR